MRERRTRPSRDAIDEAALALLARHGGQILATARRYAANHEDAEDAYQRGLEILLTKAPTTREEALVPWLKTVVKHEAFALRRQRERLTPVTGDGEPVERGSPATATHEQAERYERLSQSAEALGRLKPQEIRCLVLRAQGLSYREICATTGFTYTKVNRCLTEGRQALSARLAGIEGGAECERLAPQLSALADGEATAEQLARLRPHMKTCLACRARLREFRAAPARVAALMPPALLAADDGRRFAESALHAALHAAHHKAVALAERAQAAAELVTGQKVAALAASAAALAGGGTAVDQLANHHGPPPPRASAPSGTVADQRTVTGPSPAPPAANPSPTTAATHATPPSTAAAPRRSPNPANEFAPTSAGASSTSATSAAASASPSSTAAPPTRAEAPAATADLAPTRARPAPAASPAGEFNP